MAGILVNVIPKTDFTFTGTGTSAIETTVARALNVVPYREGVLVARVHSKSTTGGSTQTLSVLVRQVAPSTDDPATDFAATTAIATASFAIGGGTAGAQAPVFSTFSAPFSPFVRVLLQATQSTTGSVFTCSVSVDLVVRE